MKFRTKDLENYLGKNINWQKIAEELTLKSFETTYEKGILDIDILPNRYSDSSSLIGLAKEISILKGISLKNYVSDYTWLSKDKKKNTDFIKIINKTKETIYYFGKVILNIQNKPSPKWLKEFVEFYGFNSINFLVDLSNFVMIEYGAPLHIFDLDKIKEQTIIIRLSKKGEKFFSLDQKEYLLPEGSLLITDPEKILGLAGIKGANSAAVDLKTKNVFIEAAIFDQTKIYQTSRKLNLKTEASYRFERKVAPIRSLQALNRISFLIHQYLNGEVLNGIINKKEIEPKIITFNFEKVNKIAGLSLKRKEIIKIFKLLGIKIEKNKLILPLDRLDLETEEDLIEEIIRIYGLYNINSQTEISLKPVFVDENTAFHQRIKEILTKLNYSEAHNYNFISKKEKNIFQEILQGQEIEVLNPISENYQYFQFTLIPNLLKSIHLNQFHYKEIRLFEISKTAFWFQGKINEENKLITVCAQNNKELILKELKGVLNLLTQELKVNFEFKEVETSYFNGTNIFIAKENIGQFGLLKKEILEFFDIDLSVSFFELNLDKIKKFSSFKKEFVFWGFYPEIKRDLSFIIFEKFKFSKIKEELKKLKINFLKNIILVDIYFYQSDYHTYLKNNYNKNDKIKSMTLRLIFQNQERNLKDEEIDIEIEKVKKFLINKFQVSFR